MLFLFQCVFSIKPEKGMLFLFQLGEGRVVFQASSKMDYHKFPIPNIFITVRRDNHLFVQISSLFFLSANHNEKFLFLRIYLPLENSLTEENVWYALSYHTSSHIVWISSLSAWTSRQIMRVCWFTIAITIDSSNLGKLLLFSSTLLLSLKGSRLITQFPNNHLTNPPLPPSGTMGSFLNLSKIRICWNQWSAILDTGDWKIPFFCGFSHRKRKNEFLKLSLHFIHSSVDCGSPSISWWWVTLVGKVLGQGTKWHTPPCQSFWLIVGSHPFVSSGFSLSFVITTKMREVSVTEISRVYYLIPAYRVLLDVFVVNYCLKQQTCKSV